MDTALLADGEEHFRIDGPLSGRKLFLRRLRACGGHPRRSPVLYVHGATFPSASSVAYRFGGRSWRDALSAAGFDVWALDFYGFGHSDRYPQMAESPAAHPPLGLAAAAEEQLTAAVQFVRAHTHAPRLHFITHSWGSMPVGRFAARHPALVDRWVLFAPIAWRPKTRYLPRPDAGAWRLVSAEDQWQRFVEDVPAQHPPVLRRDEFDDWARAYLAGDAGSAARHPPAVQVPGGPTVEILRAWQGELAYDPSRVAAPIAIIRGEWDGLVSDADATWLFAAFARAPSRRDIKIAGATHLMHLEVMRNALWQESITFLRGESPGADMTQADGPAASIPGYDLGSRQIPSSPLSLADWEQLKLSALFAEEDVIYLRLSYEVLKDQAEDLVRVWRGIILSHAHLRAYDENPHTGEFEKSYAAAVGKRFTQWVIDTAKANYNQQWLDYQYEIGLRHHRTKKNRTDGAHAAEHIRGRDLIAFAAAIVTPMKPYLAKAGHTADVVERMQQAWWKSMILQVTLWSQPYMKEGDF